MRFTLNITHTSVVMNKYLDTVVCIYTRHFQGTVIYAAPLSLWNLGFAKWQSIWHNVLRAAL